MNRTVAALLLAGATLLDTATPAAAHTELIGSSPAEGATLAAAPTQLQLTFNGPIQAQLTTITVTGPDGAQWGVGQPTLANTVLTVPVQPTGPAGPYAIGYRILSADGHPVSGTVRFALTSPAGPAAATPPPRETGEATAPTQPPVQPAGITAEAGGVPVWVWIVAAVVLLGAGIVIALRVGRSSGS